MSKPRLVTDYKKLDEAIKQQIKLNYPNGFDRGLITFKNHKKKFVSALPFEAVDRHYLVRMSKEMAVKIVKEDDDYDEMGHLKPEIKKAYHDKYDGLVVAEPIVYNKPKPKVEEVEVKPVGKKKGAKKTTAKKPAAKKAAAKKPAAKKATTKKEAVKKG